MSTRKSNSQFIRINQKNNGMYIGALTIKELKDSTFIDRYIDGDDDSNPNQGYQRQVTKSRIKPGAKYLINNPHASFGCLALNSREGVEADEYGHIKIKPNSLSVVDGQHRIEQGRFASTVDNSYDSFPIPVVIYDMLPKKDEVNIFIDQNTNQKGVPTALAQQVKNAQLQQQLQHQVQQEENIRDKELSNIVVGKLAKRMNSNRTSIFYNKIFSPNEEQPKRQMSRKQTDFNRNEKLISLGVILTSLRKVYKTLKKENPEFNNLSIDAKVDVMVDITEKFWRCIKELTRENDLLEEPYKYCVYTSKGFRFLSYLQALAVEVIESRYEGEYSIENFVDILGEIPSFEEPWRWVNTKEDKGDLTKIGGANIAIKELIQNTPFEELYNEVKEEKGVASIISQGFTEPLED